MRSPRLRFFLAVLAAVCAIALGVTLVSAADPAPTATRQTPSTSFGTRAAPLTLTIQAKSGTVCNPCTLDSFRQSVTTTREAGTGQATGRRQYEPLLIRKRIDKSTPLLYKALSSGEVLTQVTLTVHQVDGDGTASPYFTYALTNAVIDSISVTTGADGTPVEEVTFTFQKITFTHVPSKTTAEDSWTSTR